MSIVDTPSHHTLLLSGHAHGLLQLAGLAEPSSLICQPCCIPGALHLAVRFFWTASGLLFNNTTRAESW